MIEFGILIIGTVATSLIALVVLIKNSKSIVSKLFAGLTVSLVLWSITTYFSLHTVNDGATLVWIRWIMLFVVLQNTFFFLLSRVFPSGSSRLFKKKRYIIAITYSIITAISALTSFLFVDFKNNSPVPGPAMILFIPHALIFALGGLVLLIKRTLNAKGGVRVQLQYFLFGVILMYTIGPLGNFIVPIFFDSRFFVTLSPLYSVIFSGLIAYAIVAKKMFDIKAAVARSVAYILIIGTLAFIYSISLFGLVNNIFDAPDQELTRQVLSVVLVVPLIFSFEKIKQFFNRVSNKLFYQDAYDPQQFLNSLNNVLVGNIELKSLLQESAELIEETMKCEFCAFSIQGSKKIPQRIIGSGNIELNQEDIVEVVNVVDKQRHKLIVTDEIESVNSKLKKKLLESNITVAKRMYTTGSTHQEIGYLIFGGKKSGNPYSKEDIRVIEIISNELVIAIQNALRFEEIQEFTVTLQDKVNEATRDLRKANEKLKALDETKDEFISMASHQLRTPLTSVKGYLSMVVEGDVGKISKQQKDLLNQAFSSSQRMVYLIADLLNVSRLRTGKFVIENKPTQLADVIEAEMAQLQEVANSKNQTLTYKKPAKFPVMSLDETKIRQVIMNFTDNALHYTPKDGHIEVKLEDLGNSIQFTVVDDGLGVPKNEQHHLFSKFYRAGNAKKARPDGTGLGLFMAKKVIIAQGGAIIFKSEENKGSTFGFTMPKKGHLAEKTTETSR